MRSKFADDRAETQIKVVGDVSYNDNGILLQKAIDVLEENG